MLSKQAITSKIAIVSMLVLLLFLGDLKFRQWQSQKGIEQEEQSLQAQADSLQKKNDELNQSLQYLNSDDFKEKTAREQLGYKKSGETVYGFSDPSSQSSGQNQTASAGAGDAGKWWNYFFND